MTTANLFGLVCVVVAVLYIVVEYVDGKFSNKRTSSSSVMPAQESDPHDEPTDDGEVTNVDIKHPYRSKLEKDVRTKYNGYVVCSHKGREVGPVTQISRIEDAIIKCASLGENKRRGPALYGEDPDYKIHAATLLVGNPVQSIEAKE